MATIERMQETRQNLIKWHASQLGLMHTVLRDWSGTGAAYNEVEQRMQSSLLLAFSVLLEAESLWSDSDGVSINGVLPGGIHFGVIGRRFLPKKLDVELLGWVEQRNPERPVEWTFHS